MSWHDTPEDPLFADKAAATHELVRTILRCERRVRRPSGPARKPTPSRKPDRADAILSKLATRFAPGSVLSSGDVARATGCSTGVANHVRRWSQEAGCWPYAACKGGYRPSVKTGEAIQP
jgi:hypothetical protein